MTVQISLSPEAEQRLREWAAESGKDLASLVLEAVEEKLAVSEDVFTTSANVSSLTLTQWTARFRQWAASHRPLPYEANDSRESIYSGRGE